MKIVVVFSEKKMVFEVLEVYLVQEVLTLLGPMI